MGIGEFDKAGQTIHTDVYERWALRELEDATLHTTHDLDNGEKLKATTEMKAI